MSEPLPSNPAHEIDAGFRGVVLKQLRPSDAARYVELVQRNPDRFWEVGEDTADRYPDVQHVLDSFERNDGTRRYGVWVGGVMVGYIRYKPEENSTDTVELGYWMGQEYAGRGYMTAAVRTLTPAIFEEGWESITAYQREDNELSRLVLTRTGFADLGIDSKYPPANIWDADGEVERTVYYRKYQLDADALAP